MKIVPHAYAASGVSDWVPQYIASGARWVKLTDAPDKAWALAEAHPLLNVIYRRVEPEDLRSMDKWRQQWPEPVVAAMVVMQYADIRTRANLFVEGINEPVLTNFDDAVWYGQVEACRARFLKERALRAVVGNFATGNPAPGLFPVWLKAYRDNGGPMDALIGVHEYGVIDLDPAADGWNMMGHRRLMLEAGSLAAGFQWAITETGLDEITVGGVKRGGGWKSQGVNEQAYLAWLMRAAAEWDKDKAVACACLFSYRDTERWKDYEMDGAQAVNGGLIASHKASGAAPAPTTPTTEAALFEFNGFGRSVTLYKDRACTVVDRKLFADWTVQVFEIAGGNWRVTKGAAGLWMRPIALRAL